MGIENFIENCGYLGSFLLAICAAPLAWRSYRDGHSKGVDLAFTIIWLLGEILTLIYVGYKLDVPLILNYSVNIVFIAIVLKYKFRPRE